MISFIRLVFVCFLSSYINALFFYYLFFLFEEIEISPSLSLSVESIRISQMGAETKKLNARKSARNKKRYWRKGTRIEDVEEFLNNERIDQQESMFFSLLNRMEFFFLDRFSQTLTKQRIISKWYLSYVFVFWEGGGEVVTSGDRFQFKACTFHLSSLEKQFFSFRKRKAFISGKIN